MQGVVSRGLWCPRKVRAQRCGCRGEAGRKHAHPLADHLDNARGEVAHTVCAPLALMDVALPAAIRMLLKHLWQMGDGEAMVTSCIKPGQAASPVAVVPYSQEAGLSCTSQPTALPLPSASSPGPCVPLEPTNKSPGISRLKPQLYCLPAMWPWEVTFISLSLNFVSTKGMVIAPTPPGLGRNQRYNSYKDLSKEPPPQ